MERAKTFVVTEKENRRVVAEIATITNFYRLADAEEELKDIDNRISQLQERRKSIAALVAEIQEKGEEVKVGQ